MSDVNREMDAKLHEALFGVKPGSANPFSDAYGNRVTEYTFVPSYSTNIADAFAAESALPDDKREVYAGELETLLINDTWGLLIDQGDDPFALNYTAVFTLIHATPAQRVQAMLSALAKPD